MDLWEESDKFVTLKWKYMHVYVCMYVCMYVSIYLFIYLHIYIYIYIINIQTKICLIFQLKFFSLLVTFVIDSLFFSFFLKYNVSRTLQKRNFFWTGDLLLLHSKHEQQFTVISFLYGLAYPIFVNFNIMSKNRRKRAWYYQTFYEIIYDFTFVHHQQLQYRRL